MDWSVAVLPGADHDLRALVPDANVRQGVERILRAEFEGFKAARVQKLLASGARTDAVDRLAASAYPGSIRLRLAGDLRATILCLPAFRQAYVTHLFHKSRDPKYRSAVATHDARVGAFVGTFMDFLSRRR